MERHRSTFFLVMVFYRLCIVDGDGGGGGGSEGGDDGVGWVEMVAMTERP